MSKTVKIMLGIVIIALIAIGGYLAKQPSSKSSDNSFNLSVNSWVGFAPFYLAQEKGFFADEGVKVTITQTDDTAQRKAAMIKGEIDGLGDSIDLLVLARGENVPEVGVTQLDISNGADGILVTDKVNSVQDLKGKKIAVQKNFVSEAFLNYVLKKNGLKSTDVETLDTEAGAAGAAFVAGKVDVAVTFEPWLSKAKERSGGKVLVSSADQPGVVVDILSINEPYLNRNPQNVKKVMKAWFKAVDYWKANQQEADAIMATHYNLKTDEFADYISGLSWPSLQDNKAYFGTVNNPGKIYDVAQTFSDIFIETGQLTSKPDLHKAIKDTYLGQL